MSSFFKKILPDRVSRGKETLRYGPMKPVGLTNPNTGKKPYAVVQLRQDNLSGTLYNMVGFQTKMLHKEQISVFGKIPALSNAKFARMGGIHRNTFLNSPLLLNETLCLKSRKNIRFAGQITGVEGYIESATIGYLAGYFLKTEILGNNILPPPNTTAMGALLKYILEGGIPGKGNSFQPMNINFGLFPTLDGKMKRRERREKQAERSLNDLELWLERTKNNKCENHF